MEPRIQYAKASDGVSIAYTVFGNGPPLVFAPSIESDIRSFWRRAEQDSTLDGYFALGRTMVRLDARGTGASDRVEDFSLDARVRDIEAVVGKIGARRLALSGGLHGAPGAVAYAARHPEAVTELILFDPHTDFESFYQSSPVLKGFASFRDIAEENWEAYTLAFTYAWLGDRVTEKADMEERANDMRKVMAPSALRKFIEAARGINVDALLPQVQARTLIIDYHPAEKSHSRSAAALIPDARLVRFDDRADFTAHYFPGSRIMDEIAAFLGARPEGSPFGALGREARAPSGTAIILFADIADSTALTERLGDAAFREKARELDEALRSAISANGGIAIEGKVLGDGVLATFSSAREAIKCALACHAAADACGLRLHVGVHAGDVINEDNNVYGGAVNIASRVAGEAAAGETLVSDIVRGLAKTSAGVSFEDRGEHALKGVEEPVRLYAVRAGEPV